MSEWHYCPADWRCLVRHSRSDSASKRYRCHPARTTPIRVDYWLRRDLAGVDLALNITNTLQEKIVDALLNTDGSHPLADDRASDFVAGSGGLNQLLANVARRIGVGNVVADNLQAELVDSQSVR